MKTFTKSLSGLLSASALAIGLSVLAQPAVAGVVGSAHDMHSWGAPNLDGPTSTTQICVFCHTPHGANTDVKAPIWNKALPATTYVVYTSATLDGNTDAANLTVSLACLSCHDGTQARDNMINAPGSGGFNPGVGARFGDMPLDGLMDCGASAVPGVCANVANLGADISNDHPIGMNYCAAGTTAEAIAGTCGDDSFFSGAGVIAGTELTRVWVETGTADATYSKFDLPLYGGSAGAAGIQVECATCHDPHNAIADNVFLRVDAAGSTLCLTCHNK